MKIQRWTTYVLLMSASLCGCRKSGSAPNFNQENRPTLSVTPEDKCISLAQAAFGENTMQHYAITHPNDQAEDFKVIEFTWTDGVNEQILECYFKHQQS